MTDQQFDKLLRDKLGSYTEEVGDDVWAGIAKGLDRKARVRRIKWASVAAVAAAACLVGGLFIFKGAPEDPSHISGTPSFAEAEIIDAEPAAPVADALDASQPETSPAAVRTKVPSPAVKPIAEQIKDLGENVAEVVVPQAVVPEETPAETSPAVVEDGAKPVEIVDQYTVDDTRMTDIDWDRLAEEDEIIKTHNSLIAINSNISSISKEGSFLHNIAPSYAPGKDGKTAVSSVEAAGPYKFHMPVTFGLQFKTNIVGKLYVGAGLDYTYLLSEYEGLVSKQYFKTIYSKLHYMGIPVALSYNFIDTQHLGVYAKVGGALEKCISSEYVYGSNSLKEKVQGVQWSANAGVGIEYWFINRLGIYFDPSVAYYFDNNQPLSIRTDQPFQLHLEAGLRFRL